MFSSLSIVGIVLKQPKLFAVLRIVEVVFGCLVLQIVVGDEQFLKHGAGLGTLGHVMEPVLYKGVEAVMIRQGFDIRIVVVGDQELALPAELIMDTVHELEQVVMLVGVKVRLLVHALRALVGRIQQNESADAGLVPDHVLVVPVHDDGVPQPVAGGAELRELGRDILLRDGEGRSHRGEAVDLVLEERGGSLYVFGGDLADDIQHIENVIQKVRRLSQQLLVPLEHLLRMEGEVEPANEFGQVGRALQDPEEVDQVAVVVVDDLLFRRFFPQEHLRAAHAGLDVHAVFRHETGDHVVDAAFVASPVQRADRWCHRWFASFWRPSCAQQPFARRHRKRAVLCSAHKTAPLL